MSLFVEVNNKLGTYLREPFNSISHGIGVLLSAVGWYLLLFEAFEHDSLKQIIAFSTFGLSMVLLYSASACYHGFRVKDRALKLLQRIDHCMIYVLIAGTYTPISLIVLEGAWKWGSFCLIWLLALIGILQKTFWKDIPQWFSTAYYLFMGWLGVLLLPLLMIKLPVNFVLWFVVGGLIYTAGAYVFELDDPNLIRGRIGSHEVWHLLVLAGTFCHFWAIYQFVTVYGIA